MVPAHFFMERSQEAPREAQRPMEGFEGASSLLLFGGADPPKDQRSL